ncbi:MAG TPA: extracellular solute-binding protein [Firmicutes bacterium]|nr:extracellular solute-binding protein [Bacillota bacterium]
MLHNKHKLTSRVICLLLALSLSSAASCGDNAAQSDDSAHESQTATTAAVSELAPDLPAYDGDGRDFTILAKMEVSMSGRWTALDAYVEEQTGEIVNDAVYDRNIALESKYNINIKADYMDIGGQYSYNMYKEISKLIMAGDTTYDIIMPTIQDAALLSRDGMLYDLNSVGNIDLDMPWWNAQFNKDVNIGGKSYFANGDICMSFIRASYCVLFNKGIIEDYGIENPYEVVSSGEWTIDKMLELASQFAGDTDGNGKYDTADNVGLGMLNNHVEVFYTSAGGKFVTYDENDGFVFCGGDERNIAVLEKILEIYTNTDSVICFSNNSKRSANLASLGHVEAAAAAFEAGTLLFLAGTMNNVPSMRDMTTDFGILPYPKYDENQTDYYTYVQTWASGCAAIPITCLDINASSIIMEDMAYLSSQYITPAFYETALKNKYARDNESQEMLDLICETRTCDIGNLYNIGGLVSLLTNNINAGKGDFVSTITSLESSIEKTLDEINELYS